MASGLVDRDGIRGAAREQRRKAENQRKPHRTLPAFLADHYPEAWQEIQRCGGATKVLRALHLPEERYAVSLTRCHAVPYCITCTRAATARRTFAALDKFHRCTPAGEKPRFMHIVQWAPPDARGKLKEYAKALWVHLEHAYGNGIGGIVTYHDFGEKGPGYSHPHFDLTLSGWKLDGREPVHTPRYELKGKGRARWEESIREAFALAGAPDDWSPNVEIQSVTVGEDRYFRALWYQLRELVDLRKIEYQRSKDRVYWRSYRTGQTTRYTAAGFVDAVAQYEEEVCSWGSRGRNQVDRRMGHMADRVIGRAQEAMGGVPRPHHKGCRCKQCGEWEWVIAPS